MIVPLDQAICSKDDTLFLFQRLRLSMFEKSSVRAQSLTSFETKQQLTLRHVYAQIGEEKGSVSSSGLKRRRWEGKGKGKRDNRARF